MTAALRALATAALLLALATAGAALSVLAGVDAKVAHVVMQGQAPYENASGYVLLEQVAPNSIRARFLIAGVPPGKRLAHVHKSGTEACETAFEVLIPFRNLVATRNGVVANTRVVHGDLDDLVRDRNGIVVHDKRAQYVACGTIVGD